jgi:hypothetical protein
VSVLVKKYQDRQTASETALTHVGQRLANIIGRADARGYDVAKLTADQAELTRRIAAIKSYYARLISSVGEAGPKCAADGSLNAARDMQKSLKADIADLKSWYAATLQPDLVALKSARHS